MSFRGFWYGPKKVHVRFYFINCSHIQPGALHNMKYMFVVECVLCNEQQMILLLYAAELI